MGKRGDTPRRHELSERIDKSRADMEDKEKSLDVIASDVETVRHTLESLDLNGTDEGAEDIEGAIENTEDATVDVFESEDQELESLQKENQEVENDMDDRKQSSESDLGKISDSSAEIKTQETINELVAAKEAVLRDMDFLQEQFDRAKEAREESDSIQEQHRLRIESGRKGQ